MTPELILSPILRVVYRALGSVQREWQDDVSYVNQRKLYHFCAMLERKDRHEFNGKP
jgi:hypothetical protein